MPIFTDSFTRADENPLAGNWTTTPGWPALKLVSGGVSASDAQSTRHGAYWNVSNFLANHYAQATMAARYLTYEGGPYVRGNDQNSTCYYVNVNTGANLVYLYRWRGDILLGTPVATWSGAVSIGDKIKLVAKGTVIKVFHQIGGSGDWLERISYNDLIDPVWGVKSGLMVWSLHSKWDNFETGTLSLDANTTAAVARWLTADTLEARQFVTVQATKAVARWVLTHFRKSDAKAVFPTGIQLKNSSISQVSCVQPNVENVTCSQSHLANVGIEVSS